MPELDILGGTLAGHLDVPVTGMSSFLLLDADDGLREGASQA